MAGFANKMANTALRSATTILEKENVGKLVRKEIQETGNLENLTEGEVAKYVVTKRRNAIAIDSLIMHEALTESNRCGRMNGGAWHSLVAIPTIKFRQAQAAEKYMTEPEFRKVWDEQVKDALKTEYLDKYLKNSDELDDSKRVF